jgi:hypothetical protein
MTAAVQLALDRRDREITVAGQDTLDALQFVGANGGRVQTMTRGKTNAEWILEIYWQNPNAITND